MAGWTILDRLKHDPATRHIPVHIISGDENRRRGLALGAMTYLEKSVTNDLLAEAFAAIEHSVQKRVKKLLVVCADEAERNGMIGCRGRARSRDHRRGDGRRSAGRGQAAISGRHRDRSPDRMTSRRCALVEEIQNHAGPYAPPILLMCDRPLTPDEELELARLATRGHRQDGANARAAAG